MNAAPTAAIPPPHRVLRDAPGPSVINPQPASCRPIANNSSPSASRKSRVITVYQKIKFNTATAARISTATTSGFSPRWSLFGRSVRA